MLANSCPANAFEDLIHFCAYWRNNNFLKLTQILNGVFDFEEIFMFLSR